MTTFASNPKRLGCEKYINSKSRYPGRPFGMAREFAEEGNHRPASRKGSNILSFLPQTHPFHRNQTQPITDTTNSLDRKGRAMPASLPDILSGTETSSMVTTHPSLAAARATVPSASSALGLATRLISAIGSALPADLGEWSGTPAHSPSHSMTTAPISLSPMSRDERLTADVE
jgi:hypothetical protein